jgi:hypothetical protein
MLLLITLTSFSQIFHENCEPPSLSDSLLNINPLGGSPYFYYNNWGINNRISHGGINCDSCQVVLGKTQFLTTKAFNIDISNKLYLSFWHICKISPYDVAQIQISLDSGTVWQVIPDTYYLGFSNYSMANGLKFSETSYGTDWYPSVANQVPNNTWWKKEVFDLSFACGYQDVIIRFKLMDGGVAGPDGRVGWFIDDFMVYSDLSINTEELVNDSYFEIHPNPTTDFIYFNTNANEVLLFDVFGQMIYSDKNIRRIDMTSFSNGVYIAKIGDQTIKIVKQ